MMCHVTSMSRTFSTSRIQREVIQANGQSGSNQKSALVVVMRSYQCKPRGRADYSRRFPSARAAGGRMPRMPGTNLTRDEAATRAALLDVTSYSIDLDLTTGDKTFGSTTTIRFTSTEPGAETFADLVTRSSTRSRSTASPSTPPRRTPTAGSRCAGLPADNELVVRADCTYSHTGEGLHRFVDPADDRVYLYSQFEVPDARRVFTTFEQPDLKAPFTFNVTAPDHWKVVSNSPDARAEPRSATARPCGTSRRPSRCRRTSPRSSPVSTTRSSTSTTASTATSRSATTAASRSSSTSTSTSWSSSPSRASRFFEEQFDYPYPFGKYDQLYVPEYNMGAMENAGCVTLRDEYLPRSRQPRSFYEFRASVITHEMAHMWFGDLVTMQWWDDLWLNESFAEWACYWCEAEATEYTDAWTGFTNARKQTGYRAGPAAEHAPDRRRQRRPARRRGQLRHDHLRQGRVGAQAARRLGRARPVPRRPAQYFKDHEFGNAEFTDLLAALEKASGRELEGWAQEWLQTAGVNTLTPSFELGADGTLRVVRGPPDRGPRASRPCAGTASASACTTRSTAAWCAATSLEIDVEGAETDVAELVGKQQPDLLLLNDQDHAYAKIRLDERSLATVIDGLVQARRLARPRARAGAPPGT